MLTTKAYRLLLNDVQLSKIQILDIHPDSIERIGFHPDLFIKLRESLIILAQEVLRAYDKRKAHLFSIANFINHNERGVCLRFLKSFGDRA